MRVAFVPPRYGTEVIGGAESAIRMFAENLAAAGDEVQVFTTCAADSTTWANSYAEGSSDIHGVEVHRFSSTSGRDPGFQPCSDEVLPRGRGAVGDRRWVQLQGPVCPAALDAAAASTAEAVVFSPYLFWPTVHGVQGLAERAVLHPAAHDELPLHLPVFEDVMGAPRGLVFYTEAEQTLVRRLFGVEHVPQILLGLGVDPPPPELHVAEARDRVGLGDRPYLLCLGRVDDGKGAAILARSFARYKTDHPGPLALVFAGQVVQAPLPHPDIILTGLVDDPTKWGLLGGAVAFVNPSPHESFSIVLMEAWSVGRPAIVNGACGATTEHCARSSGGLWFHDYGDFEAILDRLLGDERLRDRLGAAGRVYVDRLYRWPSLIDRYRAFLQRTLG